MDEQLAPADKAKIEARYLRGTLAEELKNSLSEFAKPSTAVLKFHGIYQQDDRDLRKAGTKQITAMVRIGIPGGALTSAQYLALDRLSDIGEGALRITTRQAIQYHYVPKQRLQELMRGLHEHYLTTLAACGDVVRNVVSCPAPIQSAQREQVLPYVLYLSKSLKPKTTAYYDVWIDGERAITAEEPEVVEPLYGATYLPRKFKVAFAFAGDNTTDVYANDVGIIPRFEGDELLGFTITAGGGMGQSAGVKASHPRLADPICDIGPDRDELLEVVSAIVGIHRDFGNRVNRKLARLKYVMDAWGVAKFKQVLDERVGRSLAAASELHWLRSLDYLGWHKQDDNRWFLGVRIISGRIKDYDAERRIRTGLRTVITKFGYDVRLTAQQNLYLVGIADVDRAEVANTLAQYGVVTPESLPPVLRHALACPALPTCSLAITESERIMPEVVAEIQEQLDAAGLKDQDVQLRTSGCPNGCSRPYTAEIGIVGASLDMYNIYLGASPLGTRMGLLFAQNVKRREVAPLLRPAFELYQAKRMKEEAFGDFCNRVGIAALREIPALSL